MGYGIFKNETILDLLDRLFIVAPILLGKQPIKYQTVFIIGSVSIVKTVKKELLERKHNLSLYEKRPAVLSAGQ